MTSTTGTTGELGEIAGGRPGTPRRTAHRVVNAEFDALKSALDHQRNHVIGVLEGLSEEDLRRLVLPSGWSCLALLRHLTVDVERFWFLGVIAGDPEVAGQLTAGAEAHWLVPEGMSAEQVFADYRAAITAADAVPRRHRARPGAGCLACGVLADLATA